MKAHYQFSGKVRSEEDLIPRSSSLLRIGAPRPGRADETDPGMAGALGYEHDGEYLQPSGCGEQGGYGCGDE